MKLTLRQWRMMRGLTQPELGKAVGRTANTILNWEKGYTDLTSKDMDKLRKVLKLKSTDSILMQ